MSELGEHWKPLVSSVLGLYCTFLVRRGFLRKWSLNSGEGGEGSDCALGLRLAQKMSVEQWGLVVKSLDWIRKIQAQYLIL